MKKETKKSILLWCLLALAGAAVLLLLTVSRRIEPLYSVDELLQKGGEYLEDADYRQAKIVFDELIRTDPLHPRGYLGSAEAGIGLEKPGDARKTLEKGLGKLSDNQEIAGLLGEVS